MKVKHLKTKVVIETSKEDYYDLVNRINQLNGILNSLHEINDIYLSDITTLEKLRYEVVDLFMLLCIAGVGIILIDKERDNK